jgi:cell division protein FtsB
MGMSMGVFEFVVGLSFISTAGWLGNNWIRARHGFEPEAEEDDKPNKKKLDAISNENAELKQQLKQLQERMAVMERIATDPAERTAREIESLR